MKVVTILFVHQSAELYGSDKVLLELARGLSNTRYKPIVAVPYDGPLVHELRSIGIETHVVPLAKVSRATLSLKGLLTLPFNLLKSLGAISNLVGGRTVDLVHSNTLAVLSGALWAKFHKVPHLWHVHELIVSPAVVRKGFPFLLRLFANRVVCNSTMTQNWVLSEQPCLTDRTITIWNGVERNSPVKETSTINFRQRVAGATTDDVVVVLVGRFNRLKGQSLLVDAATRLWGQGIRNVRYLMVGSPPPGQEHFLHQLQGRVERSPARENLVILEFMEDIWQVWDACDIAVVPSTEPESFGLVAIEAMAARKPVIAAAHGGILDIVEDGVTGLLTTPGDSNALSDALMTLIRDRNIRTQMGIAGQRRQREFFSLDAQRDSTLKCYLSMTE